MRAEHSECVGEAERTPPIASAHIADQALGFGNAARDHRSDALAGRCRKGDLPAVEAAAKPHRQV